ncbi:hypothetical protein L4D08_26055 [Photobacterium chitinilyticum]|uniref:hypothetical protein n=1 Tax=Photobacterium chitinilyticum TaxID=2485123 RepID=UPI003D139BBC
MNRIRLRNVLCWEELSGYNIQLAETPWIDLTGMQVSSNGAKTKRFCVGNLCFEVVITPQGTINALANPESIDEGITINVNSQSAGMIFIDPSLVKVSPASAGNNQPSPQGGSARGCFEFEWS